ncbi:MULTISPECIES: Uma2 family endonuclease [Fischerella]|uniref:Uma2 family endonuclease n=1 Tax=Fischerella muscicola CCMEE 5323 TaxID=2019572 RepID=A0A2N6JXK7_FISMU|nr:MULTISPECIES: Uma2 family endonuclease [Fischerella]MBD2430855.1 Uma2 family endonuclease [Fischerella sp. FACHB-380]PLZ85209.1 Uma2 family endonuclease [Fischerella muscicola CCMEE 5323]
MVTTPLTLNLDTVHLTDEQFYQLCQNNQELKFERTPKGELIIMPPVGGESGNREADLIADLVIWNRQTQLGYTFSSSTIFKLPNGADRSPDAAWIRRERWEALTPEQRRKFPPIAPDFVIELRSATDDLETLRQKMQEYIDAGVQLAWLINPQQQQVEIYRPAQEVEVRNLPTELSGENILPGFSLNLSDY